jgi:phage shock protein PspC (stress-responsive transcriptional regulator)
MEERIKNFFEKNAFGVCSWIGEKINIDASIIRLYFIYASFFTFGSPIIFYLVMAFMLEVKDYIKPKKNRIWDL